MPHPVRTRTRALLAATLAVGALGGVALIACNPTTTPTTTTTTRPTTTTTRPSTTTTKATTTTTAPKATVDPTHLPVGDGKYSTTPRSGFVETCQTTFGGGGASSKGPWFNSDGTWDSTKKGVVDGSVVWDGILETSVSGGYRYFTGNDLPSHVTGRFPIASTDSDVFPYDRNPNSIASQTLSVKVPANPTIAAKPTCIRGELGIMLTGSALFSAFDAGGRDAVAWEAQDVCSGHPQAKGAYHYHSLSACIADPGTGQSNLLGYAYDGFGIYGMRGADGTELTNADLDECHGTTSPVMWDGKLVTMYHYVATREFPYVMGCFKGTPIQNQFSG